MKCSGKRERSVTRCSEKGGWGSDMSLSFMGWGRVGLKLLIIKLLWFGINFRG